VVWPAGFAEELHELAKVGHADQLTAKLQEVSKPGAVDAATAEGVTPLMVCSQLGHGEAVRTLLQHGADPNKSDPQAGIVSLRLAVSRGHADIASALLEAGAEVNRADNYGYTPLMIAAVGGHLDCLKVLLSKGASTDLRDSVTKMTAEELAAQANQVEAVELLQNQE